MSHNRCQCFPFWRKGSTRKLFLGCSVLEDVVHATGNRLFCCELSRRACLFTVGWPGSVDDMYSDGMPAVLQTRDRSSLPVRLSLAETWLLLAVLATFSYACTGIFLFGCNCKYIAICIEAPTIGRIINWFDKRKITKFAE